MSKVQMEHESYGALEIIRGHGSPSSLFCSSILHENTIRMRISKASLSREHNKDYMFAGHARKDCHVEIEMSYTQFAEAITSLNQGGGTPVAVRFANGKTMEPCPYERKDEQFRAEFESDLEELATLSKGAYERVEALFSNKKALTKAEKEEVLSILGRMSMEINSNIPFVRDSFVKQMDKVVTEAKGNIEGFIQNRMESLANAAIADVLIKGGTDALLSMVDNVIKAEAEDVTND